MGDPIAYQQSAKRIKRAWWEVAVFGIPAASAILLVARYFTDVEIQVDYVIELSSIEYWTLAILAMAAGMAGARVVGIHLLHRKALAKKAASRDATEDASLIERAEQQIRESTFIQLGVLDAPAVLFLAHGFFLENNISAVLAIFHCFLGFTALQPEAEKLLRETVNEMEIATRGQAT